MEQFYENGDEEEKDIKVQFNSQNSEPEKVTFIRSNNDSNFYLR